MSRSDWGVVAVLVACLALAWAALYQSQNTHDHRYYSYRFASDKPQEIDDTTFHSRVQSLEYRQPCRHPKGREESDLCAQWRAAVAAEQSARWTFWAFFVSALGAGISAAGLCALIYTLKQTERSLGEARDSNEIAKKGKRAWLSVENLELTNIFTHPISPNLDAYRLWFTVKFEAVNSGERPASDVIFRTIGFPKYFLKKDDELVAKFIKVFSEHCESPGRTVAPNSRTQYEYVGTVEITHDESHICDALSVLCTIRYNDGTSAIQRRTMQDFNIFERQGPGDATRVTLDIAKIWAACIKHTSAADVTGMKGGFVLPMAIVPNIIPGDLSEMT